MLRIILLISDLFKGKLVFEVDLHFIFFKGVLEAVFVIRKDKRSCTVSLEAVGGDIIDGPGSGYVFHGEIYMSTVVLSLSRRYH